MAVRFTGTFKSPRTTPVGPDYYSEYTVSIYDNDFSGSPSEIRIMSCKILWDSDNGNERNAQMIGSRATVSVNIPATDSVLATFIEDFAYGEDARFLLKITKDDAPVEVWRGIMKADQSAEDDIDPFTFKISAVCGLGLLKDIPYLNYAIPSNPILHFGIKRFTEHLKNAFSRMPHIGFWTGSDVLLRTAVDWWSASMSNGADDDPLYQGGVDHVVFHDFTEDGGIENDVLSCYDVIREIMKVFNCRIFQCEGHWRIEQIPYRSTSPYYTRDYDVTGAFLSSAVNTGTNVILQNGAGAKITLINYDFLPILKKARITYNAKRRRNLLNGKTLNQGATSSITFNQAIDSNGGDSTLRLRGKVSFSIKNNTYSGPVTDKIYLVPYISLKAGTYYWDRDVVINNFSVFYGNSNWTTDSGNRIAIPYMVGTVPSVGNSANGLFQFELLSVAMQGDGDLNTLAFEIGSLIRAGNGTAISTSDFTIYWSVTDLYLDVFDEGIVEEKEDKVVYEAVNPLDATAVYDDELKIGFSDTQVNALGRIFYNNAGTWEPAPLWGQGANPRTSQIGDILALNILNGQGSPRRRMNGTLDGAFRLFKLMQTTDGRKWMFSRVEWDLALNRMNGSWVELLYGSGGVSSTPIKKKVIIFPTHAPTDPVNPNGFGNTSTGFSINPAPAVLAPVSYNSLDVEILAGASVTSIPIKTASAGNEFAVGDEVGLVNPHTGEFQYFEIAASPALGDTALSVVSETSLYDFPEYSFLTISQKPYAFTPGNWYTFKGMISANKVIVTGFDLPSNDDACFCVVRRQIYQSPDDFTINYGDNSVNFASSLGLNGQVAYVKAYT